MPDKMQAFVVANITDYVKCTHMKASTIPFALSFK